MKNIEKLLNNEIKGLHNSCSFEDLNNYGRDRTSVEKPNPSLVVFPNSTEQVRDIIKFANKYKVGIVPSGGRTGLSGGSVAVNGEIVVSLEKINSIINFNPINRTVELGAGVIIEELINFANKKGLHYPIKFAPISDMQIGGNISTNAGGIKVIKYGLTRNWVNAITFVTGRGDILNLNNDGLIKNASGYDLRHLVIGSEGTLGIITKAIIQLTNKPNKLKLFLLSMSKLENILVVLEKFRQVSDLFSFEFMTKAALDYSTNYLGFDKLFKKDNDFYILVEFEEINFRRENITIFELKKNNIIDEYIEAKDDGEFNKIWLYREKISESLHSFKPYKNDISVLPSDIPSFIYQAYDIVENKYKGLQLIWFGHIGDGNLHLNIIKPKKMKWENFYEKCNELSIDIFKLIKIYKGSVSAEHGVGLLKKGFLHYSKTNLEIQYMKSIKNIFDPNNVMNPNKMF